MTTDQLHDLILSDPEAREMADLGNDEQAALRVSQIVEPVPSETRVTYLSLAASPTVGVEVVNRLIKTIKEASAGNLLLGEIQYSMRDAGVDIAHPASVEMLNQLAAVGAPGWINADDVLRITALGKHRPTISHSDVSRAWLRYRDHGRLPS